MSREDLTDEQLMLMLRYGNRVAFGPLFEKYRDPVFNFARRMLPGGVDAEDVCQETFLRMVGAAGGYEPTATFKTWLFTIARNCCLDLLRRQAPAVLDSSSWSDETGANPSEAAQQAEALERLEVAIGELPMDQREAFLLRHRHDMTYRQIVEVTGRPLGTVKTHIRRARLRLAEKMRDFLESE